MIDRKVLQYNFLCISINIHKQMQKKNNIVLILVNIHNTYKNILVI